MTQRTVVLKEVRHEWSPEWVAAWESFEKALNRPVVTVVKEEPAPEVVAAPTRLSLLLDRVEKHMEETA